MPIYVTVKNCQHLRFYADCESEEAIYENRKGTGMRKRETARKQAEALVEQMSVEEMISQLLHESPAIERLNIPAYNWWNEALHGVARAGTATVFPQAIGLAAAWDKELMKEVGEVVSEEGRAKYNENVKLGDRDIYKGLTFWAPNVNIFRDPRWGRGHETYGEDPVLTSELAVSFILGMQGDGPYLKTAACAKHFAVHSGPEELRHSFDARVGKKDLYETYLPAFEACVKKAGVEAVMGAYNRTNGEPCCASHELMENILREKWGFEGHYVSDCWAIRDFHEHHMVTRNGVESSAMALNAGCDLNCGCSYLCLLEAYRKHLVTKDQIKEAAVRLFTTRYLLGLFEHTEYDEIPYTSVESAEHLVLSRRSAEESIVLLKNDGILPLKKEKLHTIGVIGPNADSRRALVGNYHGTASRYFTVLEGIQDYIKEDVRILYSEGCHLFQEKTEALGMAGDRLNEARTVAENSDIVILCLGLDETLEGEEGDTGNAYASGDKKDLSFPVSQQSLLKAVLDVGKPVIVCCLSGSAMDLSVADERASAVLQVWYPGAQGGRALADILFGNVSPSGKLPVTFYRSLDNLPEFTDYSMKGRTYRYLEESPLYPFGYGLTYGGVFLKEAIADRSSGGENDLSIDVLVKNDSPTATKDVLSIYVKLYGTKLAPSNFSLAAFEKVSLLPWEEKKYHMTVPANSFLVVNEEGERVKDSDSADIFIGTNAPDKRSVELTGQKPIVIRLSL